MVQKMGKQFRKQFPAKLWQFLSGPLVILQQFRPRFGTIKKINYPNLFSGKTNLFSWEDNEKDNEKREYLNSIFSKVNELFYHQIRYGNKNGNKNCFNLFSWKNNEKVNELYYGNKDCFNEVNELYYGIKMPESNYQNYQNYQNFRNESMI